MTKQRTLFVAGILALLCVAVISSCKKDANKLPLEPISISKPDSVVVYRFPSDVVPVEAQITTDRPINWVLCVYDVDDTATHTVPHTPTYRDTLFFKDLRALNPRVNLYTVDSSYTVPDSMVSFGIIRFKVTFEAGSTTTTYGQNYPVGVVNAEKEFAINVR